MPVAQLLTIVIRNNKHAVKQRRNMTTKKKEEANTDNKPTTLSEVINALEPNNRNRLYEIQTDIQAGLAKGNKLTLCRLIHEAKMLLVPEQVQGKHSPRSKRIWGEWFHDTLKAEGISAATGFRYAEAGEVLSAKYNPAFLSALAETGIALTISPTKDTPIGQYTQLVDQATEDSELRDALKVTNAKRSSVDWADFVSVKLPDAMKKFRATKAGPQPKTAPEKLERAEQKLYDSIIASIPNLIRISGNECTVKQVKAAVHELIEKLLWGGGYEPGSTQQFSVPEDLKLAKILASKKSPGKSAPSSGSHHAKSVGA